MTTVVSPWGGPCIRTVLGIFLQTIRQPRQGVFAGQGGPFLDNRPTHVRIAPNVYLDRTNGNQRKRRSLRITPARDETGAGAPEITPPGPLPWPARGTTGRRRRSARGPSASTGWARRRPRFGNPDEARRSVRWSTRTGARCWRRTPAWARRRPRTPPPTPPRRAHRWRSAGWR